MPSEGLVPAARRAGAHAVVLSASCDPMPRILSAIKKVASELSIPVLIGGYLSAQFRSGLGENNIQFLGGEFQPALRTLDDLLEFHAKTAVQ